MCRGEHNFALILFDLFVWNFFRFLKMLFRTYFDPISLFPFTGKSSVLNVDLIFFFVFLNVVAVYGFLFLKLGAVYDHRSLIDLFIYKKIRGDLCPPLNRGGHGTTTIGLNGDIYCGVLLTATTTFRGSSVIYSGSFGLPLYPIFVVAIRTLICCKKP